MAEKQKLSCWNFSQSHRPWWSEKKAGTCQRNHRFLVYSI